MSIAGGVSWEAVIEPLWFISPVWALLFLFYISFLGLHVCDFSSLGQHATIIGQLKVRDVVTINLFCYALNVW